MPAFGVIALWPWLTLLSLLLFRDSMKTHRVLTSQVLRCVVYAAGVAVPLAVVAAWMSQSPDVHDWLEAKVRTVLLWRTDDLTKCVVLLCIPVFTYSLAIAYRRYLRFRHALLTVPLSQVLVILLLRALFQLWLDPPV